MGLRGSSSGLESGSFLYGWVTEKDDNETVFSRAQWHRGQEVRPRKQAGRKSVCVSAWAGRREEASGVLWSRSQGHLLPDLQGPWLWGFGLPPSSKDPAGKSWLRVGVGDQAVPSARAGLSDTAPPAPPTGSPRAPRIAQDQACRMRALALLSRRAVVLPLLLCPSRSPLLTTSTQKWLQQPLAQGSALHL